MYPERCLFLWISTRQTDSQSIHSSCIFPLTPPPLTWTTERMKFVLNNVFFIFPEINDLDYFFSFSKLCWEILSLPPSCHSPLHTHFTDAKISDVVCFDGMMCQASFMNNSNIFALNTQFTCVKTQTSKDTHSMERCDDDFWYDYGYYLPT